MNYNQIQKKLEKKLFDDELIGIAKQILEDDNKLEIARKTVKLFFLNIVDHYDENDVVLNQFVKDLISIKDRVYFGKIVLEQEFYKKIKCFEKNKILLKYRFDKCIRLNTKFFEATIINLISDVSDKYELCDFLSQYKCYKEFASDKILNMISDIGNIKFINHLINNNIITNKEKIKKIMNTPQRILEDINKYSTQNTISNLNDHKYNTDNIDVLFCYDDTAMIVDILSSERVVDHFILEMRHYILLLKNQKYDAIHNYLQKNKIEINQKNFNIFIKSIKKDNDPIILKIFKIFINNENIEMELKDLDLFENENAKEIIRSVIDNISEEKLTNRHLQLACKYNLEDMMLLIIGCGMTPTQKCYQALFTNKNNNKSYWVDLFVTCGYKLTDDDIIFATKHKVILNNSHTTRNFVPNKDFYELCDLDFMPKYNDKMYYNVLWIQRICKISQKATDLNKIKSMVQKHNIKMDQICLDYLENKKSTKIKQELISMCH